MKIDGFLHCDFYAPTAQISDAARVKLILYTGYLSLEATHRSISGFQAKARMKISVAVYAVKNYRKCHSSKHFNAFKCIFKERKNSLCF